MDNPNLPFDSTVVVQIKKERVESRRSKRNLLNDELPWDNDEDLKSADAVFVHLWDESEGITEKEMDPLAQSDENSDGHITVGKQTKNGDFPFIGEKRPGDPALRPELASGGESYVWVCSVCLRACASQSLLAEHVCRASETFECDVCHERFASRLALDYHRPRAHRHPRPYVCPLCGMRFTRSGNLRAHMRTHSGERPYECVTCGKRYAHKSNLTTHVRAHNGDWLYGCTRCSKGFMQKSHYDQHMRTHMGQKPFACADCDKKFAVKVSLARHIQTHHAAADAGQKGKEDKDGHASPEDSD